MRNFRRALTSLTTAVLFAAIMFNFSACTNYDAPLAPNSQSVAESGGLNILKIGSREPGLKKVISVSELVTADAGGVLTLSHRGESVDGQEIEVTIKLNVPPGAVDKNVELSMSLDDQELDMTFGPEGTVFNTPALLTIEAHNVDLSSDPDGFNTYYYNPATNGWELIKSEKVTAEPSEGYLRVVNSELHHFSRYAIGTEAFFFWWRY